MECEVAFGISETNNNFGVVGKEEEGKQIVMASKELIDAMECEVRTASEESSEGEIVSDEKRSTTKSTLSLSSEISEEERIRRQIRERNLKKHRMMRTKRGLKYETDLTEEDRKYMNKREDEYKHSHIGIKVVKASLIPSARDNNNELNKSTILGYVYSQGYRVVEVKESGFGRVDLIFENGRDANRCLRDNGEGGGMMGKFNFSIPNRSRRFKGIVAGWNRHGTLDELVSAMVDSSGILEVEHMKEDVRQGDKEYAG